MSDIFLSYASEDREHAEKLARALETQNLSVWWDRTIPPGRSFDEVIDEAIAAARSMVVLWSNISIGKNWVLEEATDGRERGILIPVLIDEVQPPRGFRRMQAADLSDWDGTDGDREFLRLLGAVERVLGHSRETPSVSESTAETPPVRLDSDRTAAPTTPVERPLVAILFADVAQYTALSSTLEDLTIGLFESFRRVSKEIVGERGGRVVNFLGDGMLAEFSSLDAAVDAAHTLQITFPYLEKVKEAHVSLRVGVHLGDIVFGEDGDVYGSGVNVASRIEGHAPLGGVVVSGSAYQQLRHRRRYQFSSIGKKNLKGVPDPMELYVVRLTGAPSSEMPTEHPTSARDADAVPEPDATELARQAEEFYRRKDYSTAFPLFLRSARAGNQFAINRVGFQYLRGQGVHMSQKTAARWFRQGADGGDAMAMLNLAGMYELAVGVDQDYEEAAHWYRQGADGGNVKAMQKLGFLYYKGQGVDQDYEEAVRWFRQAADGGDARAMYLLGRRYERGEGVQQTPADAILWYQRAADLGEERATRALQKLGRD